MAKINDYGQWMRGVLQHETAAWTPQCPDSETLLDWLEQGDEHPKAEQLLAHLFSCAHCRQQRVALREIRSLSGVIQPQAANLIFAASLHALPAKLRKRVHELIEDGITVPIVSIRKALERLQALTPALARGQESLFDLRPSGTAIRSGRPTLFWSAQFHAQEYEISILQSVGSTGLHAVWEGNAGSSHQLTLPEASELKPGIYLWQVIAITEHRKVPSDLVGFVVLKEPERREIDSLEQKIDSSPLARIGLYEAYGLYEEALQQTETLLQLNTEDETARKIHTQLLAHIPAARHRPS